MRRDDVLEGCRCAKCPFAKGGRPNKPVLGVGPSDPRGILVGEGPSKEDSERGKPFSGITGRQLDEVLADAKLSRDRLFVVMAFCCPPTIGRTEGELARATACCRPALAAQLSTLPDVPVLAMGKCAVLGLTGRSKGTGNGRGFVRKWSISDLVKMEATSAGNPKVDK